MFSHFKPREVHIWILLCFDDEQNLVRRYDQKNAKIQVDWVQDKRYSSRKHIYSSKFKF